MTKRVFLEIEQSRGRPDGLKTDAQGNLYVCHWAGQCMSVYSPEGECIDRIALPATHVTRATFCGADYSTIAVTSGSYQCDADSLTCFPDSGFVFSLSSSREGLPEYKYNL